MDWQQIASIIFCFFITVSLCTKDSSRGKFIPDEQRLYDQIMTGYLKTVRPVVNGSLPLQVLFSIRLNQIVNLNERQQVLTINAFIDQSWTDLALSWDPAEFQDVRSLRIPADQVWKPDTFIYNNADNRSTGFIHGTYIQIKHTGEVNWPVPVRLRSSCVVKITYFPFDYQFCMVKFGSWIYSQNLVDYNVKQSVINVDPSSYIKNSEWDLLSMKLEKSITNMSLSLGLHPHITAMLYLKRNTFYYLFNIIVPCMMLSMLTLMTFWLAPTSGEKVTLGLSVFLAFSMFMLLIAEEVPASSDAVPLIGIYLCVVMTMTSISVLCAVLVTNLHNRGSKLRPAPRWVASLFIRYLALPFRVSQDVQLLASTIFLSDYCKYFILHDSRTAKTSEYCEQETTIDPLSDDSHFTETPSHHVNSQNTPSHHQRQLSKGCNSLQTYPNFQPLQDIASEDDEEEDLSKSRSDSSLFQRLPMNTLNSRYQKVGECDDDQSSSSCGHYAGQQEECQEELQIEENITRGHLKLRDNDISTQTPLLSGNLVNHCSVKCTNPLSDTRTLNQIVNRVAPCPSQETFCECDTLEEDVWVMRDDFIPVADKHSNNSCQCSYEDESEGEPLQALLDKAQSFSSIDTTSYSPTGTYQRQRLNYHKARRSWPTHENPKLVLRRAKIMIAEWCTIAKVVDRCLFLFSLIATIFAYIFLLVVMPEGQNIKLDNTSFYDTFNTGSYDWS
ncbi:acetylcholine receptor subunit alpha-L1-like [Biomphalaria glabrata]|uniref:Acetylcholine receptor subunit alpha-L1-like n=1 Tax=Biomphalaria glabrata TaxID=6526 RepID=A0A9W2ZPM6_BIOGL|nr:acetylcholine receptor subunit alpha-L1-like [Biomphalaria glabrata]XP_055876926.1 acetylcholine receptor subunit alpha-L1-like [Biomphalaria glabrata]